MRTDVRASPPISSFVNEAFDFAHSPVPNELWGHMRTVIRASPPHLILRERGLRFW
ncbi:hypothetical protein COCNU_scaffold024667G000010 [Cocos nucifera]|nr:hypothetical protein [Cocos nucifera]